MQQRFVVIPAAYVILRRGGPGAGEVLLQLRQHTGYMDGFWASSAAGHVEAGESVLEGAQRETLEELDVTIDRAELHPVCTLHRTQGDGDSLNERVDFFFSIRRWAGEPRVAEPGKVGDLRWFPLAELPTNVVPHERMVLDRLDDPDLPPILTHGFAR